jgi:hypothetical protein
MRGLRETAAADNYQWFWGVRTLWSVQFRVRIGNYNKGSRKYEGWNSAGVGFYNESLGLVEKQRSNPGCRFEQNLLTALVSRPRTGRAGDAEDQQPRARNHVNELMRIVGV